MRSLIGAVRQVLSGLRFRLLLLLLLACLPLLALTLHTAFRDRRLAREDWQQQSSKLLTSIRREEEQLIELTRRLLYDLSQDSGIRSMNPELATTSLEEAHRLNPRYSNMGLVATNGEVMTSLFPERNSLLSRIFFRRVAQRPAYSHSRFPSSKTNAESVIHFAYPVLQQNGIPSAVVFAELNLSAGGKMPNGLKLPSQATWMEVDSRGYILAQYPEPERWVGKQVRDAWILTNAFAQPDIFLEGNQPGRARMFYAVQVRQSRFAAAPGEIAYILAKPKHTVFAKADAAMWESFVALGVAVAITLAIGWITSRLLILRPVNALVRSSARLAAGDMRVRTGLRPTKDELGQLTLAFDQMAQALENREMERQRASQKLQALSQRLVEVQETERRHLARELHDEIGQSLTAAEMNLQAALRMQGSAALEHRLEESIHAVERVLEQVHDLSLNLRPSMLDDLGLEPALRWYTHRQAALTGLRAEFKADPLKERLDPLIETECFRVAQEALTNVVRHAKASGVTVELRNKNGRLNLRVRDDGVGFDVCSLRGRAVQGDSLGLLSMEERASLAGGGLELHSIPGQGTEVRAWFPLKSPRPMTLTELNE